MPLAFSKYQGAGNDFILIDGTVDTQLIPRLCDRRFGIGADGVLSMENDLCVRIFNADGSEPPFCGNGIRCAFDYLARRLGCSELQLTMGGRSFLCRREGEGVAVHLGVPKILHWDKENYAVDTGVPHALLFVEELESVDVAQWGRRVRTATGWNATFVHVDVKGRVAVRTYERGVEAETLACGSGAAAAAWAARRLYGLEDRMEVKTRGSNLLFSFTGDAIEMVGPAVFVFSGTCVF